jgi:hypothetical protein
MAEEKDSTTSEVIKLKNVRLSFPRLFKPKSFRQGQDARYEATFLIDPSNKEHAALLEQLKAETKKILTAKYGAGNIPKAFKENLCFKNGDTKDYEGYEGMWFIATANKQRPTVVDQRKNPLTEADGKPYAGCYVNASITLWAMDNEFGKRVNANLRAIQFVRDGEAFGVKPVDADEEFDDLGEDESGGGSATPGGADDDDDFLS